MEAAKGNGAWRKAVGRRSKCLLGTEEVDRGDSAESNKCGQRGNGFQAWRMLHREFEPGLAALKGKVLADVTMMVVKTAKATEEARNLVAELKKL